MGTKLIASMGNAEVMVYVFNYHIPCTCTCWHLVQLNSSLLSLHCKSLAIHQKLNKSACASKNGMEIIRVYAQNSKTITTVISCTASQNSWSVGLDKINSSIQCICMRLLLYREYMLLTVAYTTSITGLIQPSIAEPLCTGIK